MSTNGEVSGAWTPRLTFGDRVRLIRRELQLSQEQLASRLGVKKVTLGAWEVGRNEPSDLIATAKRIQLATGVPASWIVGLDDPDGGGPGGLKAQRPQQDSNLRHTVYDSASWATGHLVAA